MFTILVVAWTLLTLSSLANNIYFPIAIILDVVFIVAVGIVIHKSHRK